ncbi:MAG: hypothetical protein R3B84_07985 [Zavarzinella sp.]
MPTKPISIVIILAWLTTMGWLVKREYYYYWNASPIPPVVADLADEVAPERHSWTIYRNGDKAGMCTTVVSPLGDGLYQLESTIRDLKLPVALVTVQIPYLRTQKNVNRLGELQTADVEGRFVMMALGLQLEMKIHLYGTVVGDEFRSEADFDTAFGKSHIQLAPTEMRTKTAFSPLQPMHKYPGIRSGQSWKVSNFDVIDFALTSAFQQFAQDMLKKAGTGKLPINLANNQKAPEELLAVVLSDRENVQLRNKTVSCQIIEFRGKSVLAKSFVDPATGKVLKQEVGGYGESLILQRD